MRPHLFLFTSFYILLHIFLTQVSTRVDWFFFYFSRDTLRTHSAHRQLLSPRLNHGRDAPSIAQTGQNYGPVDARLSPPSRPSISHGVRERVIGLPRPNRVAAFLKRRRPRPTTHAQHARTAALANMATLLRAADGGWKHGRL